MSTKEEPPFFQKALHLFIFFSLAVVHPVFQTIARTPEFLAVRKSEPVDVLFLAFALCFLLPGLLAAIVWLLGHRRLPGKLFFAFILFVLFSALLLAPLQKVPFAGSSWIFPLTAVLSFMLIFLYFRHQRFRGSLSFLSPVLLIVPVLFFSNAAIRRIVWSAMTDVGEISIHSKHPVVMIVFDELPLRSLLDRQGNIDAERYPNFAEMARRGIWYRNATTVSSDTVRALPAIMTGNYPHEYRALPNRVDYPRNLVTLLEKYYDVRVTEYVTGFSPKDRKKAQKPFTDKTLLLFADLSAVYLHQIVPPDQTHRLPVITQTWGNFWSSPVRTNMKQTRPFDYRAQTFRRFTASINRSKRPRFYFLHTMLPHVPWQYFPSGTQYNSNGIGYFGVDGLTKRESWIQDPIAVDLAIKRHLLQVEFVDRLLGEVIQRLKKRKLFHSSLVVVLSDHGMSFQPGSRRGVTPNNLQDVVKIPLFIKLPFQTTGITTDINAQTIDLVPTVREVLNIDCDWTSNGRSLIGNQKQPEWKTVFAYGKKHQFPATPQSMMPFVNTDPAEPAATRAEWIGQSLGEFHFAGKSPVEVRVHNYQHYRNVDPNSGFIPALVTADMPSDPDLRTKAFGIVVNDVLRGITRPFQFGDKKQFISTVVSPSSFRPGQNRVEVVLLPSEGKKEFLRPHIIQEERQPVLDFTIKSDAR